MKHIYTLIITILFSSYSYGQTLLNENFDYGASSGNLTTITTNWTGFSGSGIGTDGIGYITTSLSMTAYPCSGIGGALTMDNAAEDIERGFTAVNSGVVYMSALFSASSVSSGAAGTYFLTMRNGSSFHSLIYTKTDGAGGMVFGVRETTSDASKIFGSTSFALNTTYLLVLKYDFTAGSVSLYVLPSVSLSEPVSAEATTDAGTNATSLSGVSFRQATAAPTAIIDGIRVATSWNGIMVAEDLVLGTLTTTCNSNGSGLDDDTYNATIAFTGGLNGNTFTLSTTGNIGTISGDNPTTSASGTIIISNIPEGTGITLTASDIGDGGTTNKTKVIDSPVCYPLVLNETLFDPPTDSVLGDANGDGTRSALGDEFVEFVNTSNSSIDISGFTISDDGGVRHIFPSNTIIPAGGTIVVFGSGNPTGIPGIVQIASSGELNLNNATDSVILKNPDGVVIINFNSTIAGLNLGLDLSGARNPDITGNFVLHNAIAGNPVSFSPGRLNADNVPIMKTWSGTTNNDWATATNWISNSSPSITDNVVIPAGLTNYPTATSAVTVNSVLINSGASLIAQDAFTASITYNRNLPTTDNWYLVSSPVSGESIEDLISNFTFASGTGANIGFSTFNNTGAAWTYASAASTGNIVNGKGYSVRLATPGNIGFTGTANTSDVTFALTQGTNNFNLVGNPFTASINSTTFLTNETANVELTFWMWNGTSYDTRTTGTHPNFKIAPGQAFFVEAKTTNNVTFTEALQSHETTDTFQKNSNTRPELKLTLSDGTQSRKLEVFYIEGTTKGFDNGFDGKLFGGVAENFSLYSELLAENVGVKYAVQSLPNSDFENMVVPVGIKAAAGKEITFSAEAMNIPDGINVYLEDRTANTVTLLSEANATYKVTLGESLDGIGRFYLHTKASGVLSTSEVTLDNISIYSPAKSTLRISGLSQGKASVKIYSLLGKEVFANTYNTTGVIDMNLPKLATGLYVVQLETEKGTLNKKITLE